MNPRLELFPLTTTIQNNHLHIGGSNLKELAEIYGTPLYVYDQATLDDSVEKYRRELARYYPGQSGITYAGKAFLCLAIAQWTASQGLWLDCTGAGEIFIATAAGVPRENILVHGVNKSPADLQAAIEQAGTLVVDNLAELNWLINHFKSKTASFPDIWLRLRPGLAVETHAYTQTGQEDSKFGMNFTELYQAVHICLEKGLPLSGLHFHQGSHFHDPAPIGPAFESVLDWVSTIRDQSGWLPKTICPGGGWGVPYHEDELPHPSVLSYVAFLTDSLVEGCEKRRLPLPKLQIEPGRSLVARAGVCLYRVGAIKNTTHRRWLLLDGGLADNPRPAIYRARYTALPVCKPDRPDSGTAWFAGPYCESSDILIEDLPMPDVQAGEFIAVPVSGAYQLAMGSNYNGARKPAVIWLKDGEAQVIQRRETLDDLTMRDQKLSIRYSSKKG